jgi:HPr kinase/phosphorylase
MIMATTIFVHATSISLNGSAVLIRGTSGSGKSDLALQVLETQGCGLSDTVITARLIADDQTVLTRQGHRIVASAPASIQGLFEVRGQGLLRLETVSAVPLVLVVDLAPANTIERLPEPQLLQTTLLGLEVVTVTIDPAKPSAAARLRTAWAWAQRPENSP